MRCTQCVDCVLGPTPELREETSPDKVMTIRVPKCFEGSVYYLSGHAVCTLFKRWDR